MEENVQVTFIPSNQENKNKTHQEASTKGERHVDREMLVFGDTSV
jgi:hypothetical protein